MNFVSFSLVTKHFLPSVCFASFRNAPTILGCAKAGGSPNLAPGRGVPAASLRQYAGPPVSRQRAVWTASSDAAGGRHLRDPPSRCFCYDDSRAHTRAEGLTDNYEVLPHIAGDGSHTVSPRAEPGEPRRRESAEGRRVRLSPRRPAGVRMN